MIFIEEPRRPTFVVPQSFLPSMLKRVEFKATSSSRAPSPKSSSQSALVTMALSALRRACTMRTYALMGMVSADAYLFAILYVLKSSKAF